MNEDRETSLPTKNGFTVGQCVVAVDPIIVGQGEGGVRLEIGVGTVGEVTEVRDRTFMYKYVVCFDRGGDVSLTEKQAHDALVPGATVMNALTHPVVQYADIDRPHRHCAVLHPVNIGLMTLAYLSVFWLRPWLAVLMSLPFFALAAVAYRGSRARVEMNSGEAVRFDPDKSREAALWDAVFGACAVLFLAVIAACSFPSTASVLGTGGAMAAIFGTTLMTLIAYGIKNAKHKDAVDIVTYGDPDE